jgi:RNA polymerase sigma-70 factor (ECF subfamily)
MDASTATGENDTTATGIDLSAALEVHERWLRTVVLARVGEAQAVDEVMQEVALATVQGRSQPADPSKVPAWLYRVAVTQSLLHRRKLGRQRRLRERYREEQASGPADETRDPLGWLLHDERIQMIRRALQQLSPKDAEILLLKYTENLSYHTLATRLGISESAVEARLHRARQRMREKLAQLDVIEGTRPQP